jgi:hypothetical protein
MSYEYGVGLGTNGDVRRVALSPTALRLARSLLAKPAADPGVVMPANIGGGFLTGGGTTSTPPTSTVDTPPPVDSGYTPEGYQPEGDEEVEGGMTTGQIALWLGLGAIVLGGGGFVLYKLATGGKKAPAPAPAPATPAAT